MGRLGVVVGFMVGLGVNLAAGQARPDTTKRDSIQYLPEVNVTSLRRTSTSIFAAPLAITRLNREAAFGTRGYSLDELIGRVPGVFIQSRYGSSDIRLTIRGFGARGAGDRSNAGTSRGVRVLIDGFPETEPDGRTSFDGVDLAAVQSVEVVRSNASSLFGNAAGGVVSLSTLSPHDVGESNFEISRGGYGLERYVARTGGQLGDGAFSATMTRTVFDGWRANSAADRWLFNGAITAGLGDSTTLGVFLYGSDNAFAIPGPLTQAEVDANPEQANPTYLTRRERRHNRVGRLGTTIEHRLGAGGVVSGMLYVNPKYLQRSERGTFRDFTRYHLGGNVAYTNAFRLGATSSLKLVTGVDEAYQDGAILFYSLTPTGERGSTLRDNKSEGANNLGAFTQAELLLGDRWGLSVGARYDRVTYYNQNFINPKLDADKAFSRVTPKLGVNFQLTPTHSFYASLGGGIEVPAGNETDPAGTFGQDTVTAINPLLDAIRSTTYEVGTKQLLLPATGAVASVMYDVALYQTEVRNEIVPYRGGRFYFTAGKVRRQGAELGLTVEGRGGVGLATSLTWSRHRYTEYQVDSVHYGRAGAFADYSGNRVVGIPTWSVNSALHVSPRVAKPLRFQVGVQGNSRYFADDANAVPVPGYLIANAAVGLERPVALGPRLTLRATIGVNNLFDRRYLASAFLNPDVVNGVPVAFEPGLARAFVVSGSFGWR